MALKPDREFVLFDISYFVTAISGPDTTRMTRGGGLCVATSTPGSGAAMDSANQLVEYATSSSGRIAAGILLNDFVNIDFSRQHLNDYKDELQIGNKAVILKDGWVVTNAIMPGQATGTMPATAYIGSSGNITDVNVGGFPTIGQFLTRKDSDGYAKLRVNV